MSLVIYIFLNRSLGTFFHGFRILFPFPDSDFRVLVLPVVQHSNCNFVIKSWDECNSKMKQVTCLDSQDRCGKVDIKPESSGMAGEGFAKGCSPSSDCSVKNCKAIYPSVKITKCRIDCCKGDLCNGAKVPMVSAIMLLACALVAFAR